MYILSYELPTVAEVQVVLTGLGDRNQEKLGLFGTDCSHAK